MPVKQPVNAASGSLPSVCLFRIWEDGSPHYSRECLQGERTFSQLGIPDIEQASNDAEPGQQYPPQRRKSRELRGCSAPLQNMAITSLWYRCILLQPLRIEKDSRAASIDFTGEKDYRIANMPLPERNNEQAANTYLQWEKE